MKDVRFEEVLSAPSPMILKLFTNVSEMPPVALIVVVPSVTPVA
jgi:hypothetical protein